jgi:poly-gamma-glutamate synthesis protein (capsule biosynthesis protein)
MPAGHSRRNAIRLLGAGAAALAVGGRRGSMAASADREETGPADGLTLFLCGDVMTGRGIDQILPHPSAPWLCESYVKTALGYVDLAERAHGPIVRPVDPAYIWGEALTELNAVSPDLRIVNLETSITRSDDCAPKGINYRMHPANAACLTAAGIDCCVLANNHVLDWGEAGLLETLDTLDAVGMAHAGAGRDAPSAQAPAVLPHRHRGRVLVFACGEGGSGIPRGWAAGPERPGVHRLPDLSESTLRRLAAAIEAVRRPGDIVIVSIHWGPNWGYAVPRSQRDFAHGLIERAGVDLVHGHSSHHAKGIEVFRDRLILYGCGDFLNDYEGIGGHEEYRDDLVLMYLPTLSAGSGRLLSLTMVPLQLRRFRLVRPSSGDAAWLYGMLNREGRAFGAAVTQDEAGRFSLTWS